MEYLYHWEFQAWMKIVVLQKAGIECIPMVLFTRVGELLPSDVPLRYQVSTTTQQTFNIPILGELLKCDD